ncbi:MAG: hypothetical protein OXC13_08710 [Caldilineaceae bacterium]|nr:hypothetical protein [Caldilineaceae bacterium]
MPTPNLRISADPKAPTADADPEVAAEAAAVEDRAAAVREDRAAWEVPAGGRA